MTNQQISHFKIALIGEANAGKTTLSTYVDSGRFVPFCPSTVGASYYAINYENKTFNLWDTSGQEKFAQLTSLYYRNASIMLLVFDASNPGFEKKLRFYLDETKYKVKEDNDYKIIIICNKIDLVNKERLIELRKQVNKIVEYSNSKDNVTDYVEVSSKNKIGREVLLNKINTIANDFYKKREDIQNQYSLDDNIIDLEKQKRLEKSGNCC